MDTSKIKYIKYFSIFSVVSSNIYNQFFAFIGLVLIVISIVFFDNRNVPPFPNSYTLIPTVGATLIILFGQDDTLVGRLLSIRPLRWIGLISYSVYLWHQPLPAFVRIRATNTPEILPMLMIVSIVFPLSTFSYLFIEKPFRNKNNFSRKQIFSASCITAVMTFILALFLIQTATNRTLLLNKAADSYLSDLAKYGHGGYVEGAFDALRQKTNTFSTQTSTINKKLILIGDSFAQDFYNIIIEGKHLTNYEIRVFFVHGRCQMYIGPEDRKQFINAIDQQTCENRNDIKYALPLIRQADIIILSGKWFEWSAKRLPMTLKLLNLTKQQQIFVIGRKHFGNVNLKLYVNKSTEYRLKQYQYPSKEVIEINNLLEKTIDEFIFVNIQGGK
ncbi:unnamed protein product [Rotaria sp. Silwood2]|nr:unnamed protein product [Rotaria sp. Silwood2]